MTGASAQPPNADPQTLLPHPSFGPELQTAWNCIVQHPNLLLSPAQYPLCGEDCPPPGIDASDILPLLMLLVLDEQTLDEQIPMGRQLLQALAPMQLWACATGAGSTVRDVLLAQVRAALLDESCTIWDWNVQMHGERAMKKYRSAVGLKGMNKNAVITEMGAWMGAQDQGNFPLCYPSLMQVVYNCGSRKHVLLDR